MYSCMYNQPLNNQPPPQDGRDGMAVDDEDRLYVATGGGIEVLGPQGEHLGIIPVRCLPRDCQNVAFGGPMKQTLYIAGAGSLYKVEMIAKGLSTRAK